jgi:hypothetical protein
VGGAPLSGAVYVSYVESLLDKLNAGVVPRLEDTWTLLSKVQHRDEEDRVRARLLALAVDCPSGAQGTVYKWVEELVTRELQYVKFVPPAPDVAALTESLCATLRATCAHKIADPLELARAHVDAFFASPMDKNTELTTFFDRDFETNEVRTLAIETFSHYVVSRVPELLECSRKEGEERAVSALALDLEATKAVAAGLKIELEEARLPPVSVPKEEAATQTDEEETPLDEDRRVAELEGKLTVAAEELQALEVKSTQSDERSRLLKEAFARNTAELARDTADAIAKMKRERDDALEGAKRTADQRNAVEEESNKLRVLIRDAQERVAAAHKTSLDELRLREKEFGELTARYEVAATECRGLKRRVDELLLDAEDHKRLRSSVRTIEVERAREEAERDALRAQAQTLRKENEALRRSTVALESRLAAAECRALL